MTKLLEEAERSLRGAGYEPFPEMSNVVPPPPARPRFIKGRVTVVLDDFSNTATFRVPMTDLPAMLAQRSELAPGGTVSINVAELALREVLGWLQPAGIDPDELVKQFGARLREVAKGTPSPERTGEQNG